MEYHFLYFTICCRNYLQRSLFNKLSMKTFTKEVFIWSSKCSTVLYVKLTVMHCDRTHFMSACFLRHIILICTTNVTDSFSIKQCFFPSKYVCKGYVLKIIYRCFLLIIFISFPVGNVFPWHMEILMLMI